VGDLKPLAWKGHCKKVLKNQIDSAVNSARDEILSFIQTLVQSPSLANDEGPVQELVSQKLKSLHLNVEKIPVCFDELKDHPAFNDDGYSPDSRHNVIGHWKNNGSGKSIILNGHVDVVPTGSVELWDESPWSGAIKNERIYGRGSCDMKAGLASGIFAIQILKEIGFKPSGNVMVQSVVGEESGGCGTLANVVNGLTADGAVILEPTSLKICPIHSGALNFRLTIPGKATHGAMRWEGVSAIEKTHLIHQSILDLEQKRNEAYQSEYYKSYHQAAPINLGTIQGGDWHSSVPDTVVVEGRFGIFPGEAVGDAKQTFETHIHETALKDAWLKDHPPVVEWFEGQYESGQTDPNHPFIQLLANCFAETTHHESTIEGVTYAADMALFTNYCKIPAVLFGPGDVRRAHAINEYVEINDVLMCVKIIANMIVNWCGESHE
jgi:acetylornithine deacetylase